MQGRQVQSSWQCGHVQLMPWERFLIQEPWLGKRKAVLGGVGKGECGCLRGLCCGADPFAAQASIPSSSCSETCFALLHTPHFNKLCPKIHLTP